MAIKMDVVRSAKACYDSYSELAELFKTKRLANFRQYLRLRYGIRTPHAVEVWALQKYYTEFCRILVDLYGNINASDHEYDYDLERSESIQLYPDFEL